MHPGPSPKQITLAVALAALLVAGGVPRPAHAALISTQQEVAIGREAARDLESRFGVVRDAAETGRLAAIGGRLAAVSDRRDLPWTFRILNQRAVNAVSLPGGFVYVTRGMLDFVRSEDELAFVLAHEVAHVNQRHHVNLLERHFFMGIVISLLFGGDPTATQVANFVGFLLSRGFSRSAEFEADQVGVHFTHRAGFRADAGLQFMERLRAAEGRDPSQFEVLFRTHPALPDRIVRVREELRRLGYQARARERPGIPGYPARTRGQPRLAGRQLHTRGWPGRSSYLARPALQVPCAA
ncbi:MAG: M48 family metalloprotease [Armatimonadota bacterium]|nr:M48 family metalloprotease [Armatimonadota bacterium]